MANQANVHLLGHVRGTLRTTGSPEDLRQDLLGPSAVDASAPSESVPV